MNIVSKTATGRAGISRDAITWCCYLLLGYLTFMMAIQGNILPFLKAELSLNFREVSLHTSALAVGFLVVGFLGDRFIRRYGRRVTLWIGVVGSATAALLLCLSPAAWASIGSCAFIGVLIGLVPVVINSVLADVHGVGVDIAFAEANAVSYAFAVMAPILTGLCVWFGLNWRLAIVAGVLAGLLIMLRYYRTPVPGSPEHIGSVRGTLPVAFWLYWAALGFAVALEFSILLWAPAYLEKVVGLTLSSAAIGSGAFLVAMLVGRVAGTWLLRLVAARRLFLAACVTTVIGFAAYWGTSDPAIVLTGLFIVGLGVAMTFPLLITFALGSAGGAFELAATRVILAPALAILLGPPALGAIADSAGLAYAQLMTPVIVILALAAFVLGEMVAGRERAV